MNSDNYVESKYTEGPYSGKTSCITAKHCVEKLHKTVINNATCENIGNCDVFLQTTPSTMKWFCDENCDYEMIPYNGE